MKKYYRKYLILAIMGSIIIGVAFYLLLNNYLDRKEIIVASRDINIGEKIGEDDLYFKEYYKNSLPENYLVSKEDAIGNIINIERKKDDYISKDMFDKDIQISIFDNLLPGDVMIAVNIQYLEPILRVKRR
jgi:Flp pilus assembly protein CpaB